MATIARLVTVLEAQMKGFEAAQTSLQKIEKGMGDVSKSVDSVAAAVGTANKVLGAFGVVLSVGAVTSFAKEIGEFAGDMLDLSAQTKVSTDRLQAFNIAGSDVGLTIEDITMNMDQLAKRVGSGDASAVGALQKLNINVEEFKQLSLDEALFLIDKQAASVSNQFDIATLKAELFGKGGQRMGRMLTGSLEDTIKSIEKTGSAIDHDMLEAIDQVDDAFKRTWIEFRAYSAWAIMGAIQLMGKLSFPGAGTAAPGVAAFSPMASHGGGSMGLMSSHGGTDTVLGSGLPGLTSGVNALDKAYNHLMSDIENERGLFLMKLDADLLNSSLSTATVKLRELAMLAGTPGVMQSGSINPALLMGGPGKMPYGGNLYTYGSGVPLLGQGGGGGFFSDFFGGLTGGAKNLWQGLSGGKGLGGMIAGLGSGFLSGGISSALGLGMQGISALVGKMFGGEGKKTNDLRDQLFGGMGGFENVSKLAADAGFSMDRLLQPKKVKDMEAAWKDFNAALQKHQQLADTINQLTDAHAQRQQMLNDAMSRYNFTAQEKGPLINMQEMAAQAEQLLTDYQLLTEAGVDHTAVLREMSGSVSEFVNRAIKTGTEVPEAMRKMIEEMITNGELLDENGVAFQSLEQAGIHFGESLTDMFKGVLQKLDELIAKLDAAAKAAMQIPASVPGNVINPDIANGGYETIPMAAGGFGRVTRPTLFLAGEHGAEDVAFSGGGRSFGGGGGALLAEIRGMRSDARRDRELIPILARDAALKAMA